MSFVPNNRERWGFSGHLFVALDEDYAIKKCSLNIPKQINVNFISDVAIEQDFEKLNEGLWGAKQSNVYANFYVIKNLRHLYYHQNLLYGEYNISPMEFDSVFSNNNDLILLSDAEKQTLTSLTNGDAGFAGVSVPTTSAPIAAANCRCA